jgi:hypothetical protein
MQTTRKHSRGRSLGTLAATLGLALLAALLLAGPAAGVSRPKAFSPDGNISASTVHFDWSKVKFAYYELRVFNANTGDRLKKKEHIRETECTITGLPQNVTLSWDVRALIPRPAAPSAKSDWSRRLSFTIKPPVFSTFGFADLNASGVIDDSAHTVAVTVPLGTDRAALTPTFTSNPRSKVRVNGIEQRSGEGSVNFTNPVRFMLTSDWPARNWSGATNYYDVTVKFAAETGKAVTAFSFQGLSPPVIGTIDEATSRIALTVPSGTAVTALIATFAASPGAVVTVSGYPQASGVTPNNFSNPVRYTVTGADGSSRYYDVTVKVAVSSSKAITRFDFQGLESPVVGTINEAAHTIALTVPYGTNVTALVPTITISGTSVNPLSGVANNFTNPVTYTVTAGDGTTQAYVVTVNVEGSPAKALTAFSFRGLSPVVVGSINEAAHSIALTVPYGTNVGDLVATFSTTGASVSVNGTPQVSGVTPNNFASATTYTVAAGDGSSQNYVVTVTVAARVPAVIGSVSPTHGLVGARVTLTGTGFGSSGGVAFGGFNWLGIFQGTSATIVSWSDTRIVCDVPQRSPGLTGIYVRHSYIEGMAFMTYYSNGVSFTVDEPPV